MYTNINFNDIRKYLNEKKFPEDVCERGKKANFKRQCKNFEIVDNKLMYCKKGRRYSTSPPPPLFFFFMTDYDREFDAD